MGCLALGLFSFIFLSLLHSDWLVLPISTILFLSLLGRKRKVTTNVRIKPPENNLGSFHKDWLEIVKRKRGKKKLIQKVWRTSGSASIRDGSLKTQRKVEVQWKSKGKHGEDSTGDSSQENNHLTQLTTNNGARSEKHAQGHQLRRPFRWEVTCLQEN